MSARELLRGGVARRDHRRARQRRIGKCDGRRARTCPSRERLKESGRVRPTRTVCRALRDPVHAHHGAVAEQAAATDGALPAHDRVEALVSNVPVRADACGQQSRGGHRAKPDVLRTADAAVSLDGAADDAEQRVERLHRRLVERVEHAVAERRAGAAILAVRRSLRGELLLARSGVARSRTRLKAGRGARPKPPSRRPDRAARRRRAQRAPR